MKKTVSINLYIERIRNRLLKHNKNWIAIICGETGSAKSYSAMSLADLITKGSFNVKLHVVFSPVALIRLVNNPQNLKKGDIIIFDEAGVGMSSRDWYSVQNKLLGSVLQTFRNLNIGLIFTTPNLSFLDTQGRKLIHAYMETKGIDRVNKVSYLKVYDVQVNSRFDKTYFKAPIFKVKNQIVKCPIIALHKISSVKSKQYEILKTEYTKELNLKALQELENSGQVKVDNSRDTENTTLEDVKKNISKYMRSVGSRKFLDIDLLQANYNLTIRQANRIKKQIEPTL